VPGDEALAGRGKAADGAAAEQAQRAGLLEVLVDGEAAFLLPLVDVGIDLLVDEVAHGAAEFFVFLGEDHLLFSSWT